MENTAERMGTGTDRVSTMSHAAPNALSEQVDRLHAEVQNIAKDMASLHAIEKAVDQKAIVIGRALVEQKNSSAQVAQNQDTLNSSVAACVDHAEKKQTRLVDAVKQVDASVEQLRSVEKREDTLLKSLDKLVVDQQAFMDKNKQFNTDANGDLDIIKKSLQELRRMVSNMSFEDQVAFMEEKAKALCDRLDSYVAARTDFHQNMSASMADTVSRIDAMQSDMEAQRKAIASVVEISRTCETSTNLICEKLERLLEAQKAIQPVSEPSLEDLFAVPSDEPATDDGEEPDACQTEPVAPDETIEDPAGTEEETTEDDNHKDDPVDEDEDEVTRMFERPAETPTDDDKRKKGFFARVFGGGR